MAKQLIITDERVLAAAAKCGDAKAILKELFPDVFKVSELVSFEDFPAYRVDNKCVLECRLGGGAYHGTALYLSPSFVYEFVDDFGARVLVVRRR